MRPNTSPNALCLGLLSLSLSLAACGGGDLPPDPPPAADAGSELICPVSVGATNHQAGTISNDQTWRADGSPHVVFGDIHVKGGTLTLEPCATVELTAGASIFVEENGVLVAQGTADKMITIDATDPTKPWKSLVVTAPGRAKLAHTTISMGGKGGAMMVVSGEPGRLTEPAAPLLVEHVTLSSSFNYGLELRDATKFDPASAALTIKDCGADLTPHAMIVNYAALSSIPDVTFKGNRSNAIKIKTGGSLAAMTTDQTLRNRGVPYVVGGQGDSGTFLVASGNASAPATLTIEPGVTLKFARDAKLVIEDPGADPTSVKNATGILAASTTSDKPITLTSAEDPKLPGDWGGVIFGGRPNVNNRIDGVTVAWAGGTTASFNKLGCNLVAGAVRGDAAIVFPFEPPAAFLKNSAIQHSAAHGIARAWAGAANVSFLADATNSFSDIAGCNETAPKLTDGTCPTDPPCPK